MPTCLVTGGAGFFGSHVCDELLRRGNDKRRLARMSKRARATVRRRFTVDLMARRFGEVLADVAEAAAAGRPRRPPALTWGARSMTGHVIPGPNLVRPTALRPPGLG